MAAVPTGGAPQASAAPPRADPSRAPARPGGLRRRLLALGVLAAIVAALFVAYLQVSRTYTMNSDSANLLLMSWDMLHGNVLLHGWYLSDVSFYTTELPQYALLEAVMGLHAGTAHVAAAMTYTLVLILAVLLARGWPNEASGRPGWAPMGLTAGLMIAPQLGVGVFVLLLSVGHIGTAVPLMLIWLLLDWAAGRPPGAGRRVVRWAVPAAAGILLTWVLIADPLAAVVGIAPLVVVCAMRVIGAVRAAGPAGRRAALRGQAYELSLAVAAVASYGLAAVLNHLLRAGGGFFLHPVGYHFAPLHTWPKHALVTGQGLLALFGAKPQGPAAALAFALVHLAGVGLVVWAMGRVARRFLRWPDLVSQVLLVAIVLNVVAYVPSTLADATDLNAREFAIVLPFGAVLAGRALAGPVPAQLGLARLPDLLRPSGPARWRSALAAVVAAAYLASLGYAAAQPSVPPANAQLAAFLAEHHLTEGISGYWQGSIVTVGSDGAVTIRAVQASLKPYLWEAKSSWYDPRTQRATFLVSQDQPGYFNRFQPSAAAVAALGPPERTYHVGSYTIEVWDKNLLAGPG